MYIHICTTECQQYMIRFSSARPWQSLFSLGVRVCEELVPSSSDHRAERKSKKMKVEGQCGGNLLLKIEPRDC